MEKFYNSIFFTIFKILTFLDHFDNDNDNPRDLCNGYIKLFSAMLISCFFILHCAFSNVSSNRLPYGMHSHIGYIYLTFLQSAFLNASLNCLPERMNSHTVRICLTFLHCVKDEDQDVEEDE